MILSFFFHFIGGQLTYRGVLASFCFISTFYYPSIQTHTRGLQNNESHMDILRLKNFPYFVVLIHLSPFCSFFFFKFGVQQTYNVFQFQVYSKMNPLYMYLHLLLFKVFSHEGYCSSFLSRPLLLIQGTYSSVCMLILFFFFPFKGCTCSI